MSYQITISAADYNGHVLATHESKWLKTSGDARAYRNFHHHALLAAHPDARIHVSERYDDKREGVSYAPCEAVVAAVGIVRARRGELAPVLARDAAEPFIRTLSQREVDVAQAAYDRARRGSPDPAPRAQACATSAWPRISASLPAPAAIVARTARAKRRAVARVRAYVRDVARRAARRHASRRAGR